MQRRVETGLRPALRLASVQKRLRLELEASERLRSIGMMYSLATNSTQLANSVVTNALNETGMDRGTVRIAAPSRDNWIRLDTTFSDPRENDTVGERNPFWERIEVSAEALYVADVTSAPEWGHFLGRLPDGARKEYLQGVRTALYVPMRLRGRTYGFLSLESSRHIRLSAPTLTHIEIIAQYAAAAIYSLMNTESQLQMAEPLALLGSMVGGFIHTMRNELSGARGYLDNVRMLRGLPKTAVERLDRLDAALSSIAKRSDDFATLGQPDRVTSEHSIRLNDVVIRVVRDAEQYLDHTLISVSYDKSEPEIMGNIAQLEVALQMLMRNAAEAAFET